MLKVQYPAKKPWLANTADATMHNVTAVEPELPGSALFKNGGQPVIS